MLTGTRVLTRASGSVLAVRRLDVKVARGPDKGKSLALGEQTTAVVGTDPDSQLALTDDTVSHQHVELRASPSGWTIRDLGSTNGIRLQGLLLREAVLERKSTTLALGSTEIILKIHDDEAEHALSKQATFGRLDGESDAMRALFAKLEKTAPTDSTVLIEGESGTGKELVAQSLHEASRRAAGPFVVLDCGAIAPQLVESQLFGQERGAFTGADRARAGVLEEADGGTLFLDEIGELPLDLQPKLLRALESRQIRRLGGAKTIDLDLRVLAATHRRLDRLVAEGAFRQDLFYRLAVLRVAVPPLRQRPEDILPLARAFIAGLRPDADPEALLTQGVRAALQGYRWPGNVRELRNAVERLLAVGVLETVEERAPVEPYANARRAALDRFEREYCRELLARTEGKVGHAAELAGISRQMVHRLLRRHELDD